MIRYKCNICNVISELSNCRVCGKRADVFDTTVFWCEECNIPIFDEICPVCGSVGKRIGSDLRPVFPEERLLLEIILGCPMKYKDASVWNAAGNIYYADGKRIAFTVSQTQSLDAEQIREQLAQYREANNYDTFNDTIQRFLHANRWSFHNF